MGVLAKLFGSSTTGAVGPTDAQDLLRGGALLVDVRDQREWDAGHAPKAKHHPRRGLHASSVRLPRERIIVVVCRSGNRSVRAAKVLTKAGFDAVNLAGGMTAWKAAGLALVDSRGKKGTVA